jgi:AcrR family transcriptional regulator
VDNHRDTDDLTARARIRDAALVLFAEKGMDGATVRDIAKAAGVSPGLVRHHFGSKEGLRDACDRYALERAMRLKERALIEGEATNPGFLPAAHPVILQTMRYFAQSMLDGSAASASLFDQMVDAGQVWLKTHHPGFTDDPRALSAILVAMQSGLLTMHEHLSRSLGADIFSAQGHARMMRAAIELYAKPLLTPDIAAQARAAFDNVGAATKESEDV